MHFLSLLCLPLSYLIGAIPFGLLLSTGKGVDIRSQGSGNIGATNVARLLGKKLGIFTLLLDVGKGFFPMWLTAVVAGDAPGSSLMVALAGVLAVLGHMYPVYLGFRGGKGVATGLGVFLFLSPPAVFLSLLLFLAAVYFTGFVSVGSLLAAAAMPIWLQFLGAPVWKLFVAAFIAVMIWIKHRPNIDRLLDGTEKSWKKEKAAP
jgi:glycerol-3-phosphate acyltransferase PlsY